MFMTLVNTRGVVDSPKGRALNWKTLSPITKCRYFLDHFVINMWKYSSFRSMDVVHSHGLKTAIMDDVVSILNFIASRWVLSIDRSITGLNPPSLLSTRKSRL